MIDETGGIARKEGSKQPKTVRTEANIKLVEEMILSRENQPGTHSIAAKLQVNLILTQWRCGVMVITTAQLHSTKSELWFQSCLQDVRDSRW